MWKSCDSQQSESELSGFGPTTNDDNDDESHARVVLLIVRRNIKTRTSHTHTPSTYPEPRVLWHRAHNHSNTKFSILPPSRFPDNKARTTSTTIIKHKHNNCFAIAVESTRFSRPRWFCVLSNNQAGTLWAPHFCIWLATSNTIYMLNVCDVDCWLHWLLRVYIFEYTGAQSTPHKHIINRWVFITKSRKSGVYTI